jgi:starch-binding outer membrane protein, SusD/RagB family
MDIMHRRVVGGLLGVGLVAAISGCDNFLEVRTPGIIDAGTVDPVANSETFARSALQTVAESYGELITYSAWFSNEMWVGDTFPTRNEFGRRNVAHTNGTYNNDVYQPLAQGLAQSEEAAEIATQARDGAETTPLRNAAIRDFGLARMGSGFSLVFMGEMMCEGVITGGPALTTEETLTEAAARFDEAIDAVAGLGTAEGNNILQSSRVGAARAHLQIGNLAQAIAYASAVPADFRYDLQYFDQPGERLRLGNRLFYYSRRGSRQNLVVPPHYREWGMQTTEAGEVVRAGDPRIRFWDTGALPQDETLPFYSQLKYPEWGSNVRLASGLEARYIVAEAELKQNNPAPALALIAERRTAGQQGGFTGSGSDAILRELMEQRHRDFWLEGKRMGDWRRNPGAVQHILEPGDNYYKPAVGLVEDQTCWPMPFSEANANPNIPG